LKQSVKPFDIWVWDILQGLYSASGGLVFMTPRNVGNPMSLVSISTAVMSKLEMKFWKSMKKVSENIQPCS
jgi:hypothetical protein